MYRKVTNILMAGILCLTVVGFSCSGGNEAQNSDSSSSMSEQSPTERSLASVPPAERLNYYNSLPPQTIEESKRYIATIRTNKGDIVVELDAISAPLHTNNLVFLAKEGFYNDLTFHRVVPRFVVQGGDPIGQGTGGPGYRIPAEFGLPHQQGVIAMARQPDQVNPQKMSSGSQFYITLEPQPHLDQGGYSVFGRVTQGFDVVQKIQKGDVMTRIDIEEK
ncbi:peptidylprolyl isomerase [bacterium]|nr:peptidylprolyl isomerase [bacterium]